MHVLVVEDDEHLLNTIATVLEEEDYIVEKATTGEEGILHAEQGIFDLLILDIMLPESNGLVLLKELRAKGDKTPALFLTAKDSVEDRVQGLDAGADDYLVKPFVIDELLARIRALLRRAKGISDEGDVTYGDITLRKSDYEGYCSDNALNLTSKEYDLLSYLIQNKEQILKREQIFNRIWGFDSDANDTAVDLYIHYLRKKLITHGCDNYVRTVRGVGYMLKKE